MYEGRPLASEEIGLGRGWANVTRTGREVTAELLKEPSAVDVFTSELPPRAALPELVELAARRYPGSRVSEQLALAEQTVWQLLHAGRARLTRAGAVVHRDQWPAVLLSWEAWTDASVRLESGDDVGDQPRPF